MFESMTVPAVDPEWVDEEPGPGDADYQAYLAWEARQIAFWTAYGASVGPAEEVLPDLAGMRTDAGLLGAVQRAGRAEAQAAGARLRSIADYALRRMRTPEVGYDEKAMAHSAQAEIGVMLRVTPAAASHWLDLAMTLVRRLPRTLATLEAGTITLPAARAIAEESENLDVAQGAHLEATVLPQAPERTPGSLRRLTRREVERLDAEAVRTRAEAALAKRTLYVKDEPDGMATLCAYLPTDQAHACFDAIDALVHPKAPGEDRPVGARRVDALVEVVAAATGTDPWNPPAPESSVLTPEQIAELNRGADVYVPSPAMKAAVRRRDKHCRFPGCRRPARQCEIDHTLAFVKAGGRTIYTNLACVCRFHHQIKQAPGWHCEQDDRGRLTWTTPTGLRFITRPPPDEGEEAPDQDQRAPEGDQRHHRPRPGGRPQLLGAVPVVEPGPAHPRHGPVGQRERDREHR